MFNLHGSRRGDVIRFSAAKMTPSAIWIPIDVDPRYFSIFKREGDKNPTKLKIKMLFLVFFFFFEVNTCLDCFNRIFHLKQTAFGRKSVYSSVVLTPAKENYEKEKREKREKSIPLSPGKKKKANKNKWKQNIFNNNKGGDLVRNISSFFSFFLFSLIQSWELNRSGWTPKKARKKKIFSSCKKYEYILRVQSDPQDHQKKKRITAFFLFLFFLF